jgi:hypothetical protein
LTQVVTKGDGQTSETIQAHRENIIVAPIIAFKLN